MKDEHINKIFTLELWGEYACFTRPELKVERVSYDVITPSACRNIFQSIFWKPAFRWNIRKIEVLNPIKWVSVKRNEVAKTASTKTPHIFIEDNRQQKSGTFLKDVKYRVSAELEFIPVSARAKDNPAADHSAENPAKYNAIFERRASRGQCFTQPYFGCREFAANFRLVKEGEILPEPISETLDLGLMLYDMDFSAPESPQAMFFRARMENGVILVPAADSKEVLK